MVETLEVFGIVFFFLGIAISWRVYEDRRHG